MLIKQYQKYHFNHPQMWNQVRAGRIKEEVDFIDFFLKKGSAKKILDVGCGTGLHCQELTKRGYKTVGLDMNPSMIKFAKSNYPSSIFIKGDMQDLDKAKFGTNFDAILCLCTTFAYNLTHKEINECLNNFNRLLTKEGILIIEIFNPICFLQKVKFENSFFNEDQKLFRNLGLEIEVKHLVDERNQMIKEIRETYKISGTSKKFLKRELTRYRLFFPQEFVSYLKFHGFNKIKLFGKFDRNYRKLDRTRFIVVAQKVKELVPKGI